MTWLAYILWVGYATATSSLRQQDAPTCYNKPTIDNSHGPYLKKQANVLNCKLEMKPASLERSVACLKTQTCMIYVKVPFDFIEETLLRKGPRSCIEIRSGGN